MTREFRLSTFEGSQLSEQDHRDFIEANVGYDHFQSS